MLARNGRSLLNTLRTHSVIDMRDSRITSNTPPPSNLDTSDLGFVDRANVFSQNSRLPSTSTIPGESFCRSASGPAVPMFSCVWCISWTSEAPPRCNCAYREPLPRRRSAPGNPHPRAGTGGGAAADRGNAAAEPERRSFWPQPECRHGLGSCRRGGEAVPHSVDARRLARAGWDADRARISHGALGDRAARRGGGARVSPARHGAVRGVLLRPVRRANARDAWDVRQPAVSQRRGGRPRPAHPLAAAARGRARHRHVRQGAARDDDGARRRARICRACSCRAA